MHTRVTTTIESDIDLDSMETRVSATVEAEEGIPKRVGWVAAAVGAKAFLTTVFEQEPKHVRDLVKTLAEHVGLTVVETEPEDQSPEILVLDFSGEDGLTSGGAQALMQAEHVHDTEGNCRKNRAGEQCEPETEESKS